MTASRLAAGSSRRCHVGLHERRLGDRPAGQLELAGRQVDAGHAPASGGQRLRHRDAGAATQVEDIRAARDQRERPSQPGATDRRRSGIAPGEVALGHSGRSRRPRSASGRSRRPRSFPARSRAHHQFTPPSSDVPCRRSRVVNVPADRYFQPPSGSSATIVPPPSSRASRAAATRTAPHDGPAKMPSRKTSSRSAVERLEVRDEVLRVDAATGGRAPGRSPRRASAGPGPAPRGVARRPRSGRPGLCSRR